MMTGEDVYAGAGVGAAPQPERSVSVHDLAHRFPGTDVLFEHLDFTAIPGQTVAICGPSGCGKSTLLSILAGWEKPYHGTVERKNVERVGWVFQNPYGVPGRTALDHVVFPLLAKGLRRREAEPQALEAMGLFDLEYAADRRVSALWGGGASASSHPGHPARGRADCTIGYAHRALGEPRAREPGRTGHDRAGRHP